MGNISSKEHKNLDVAYYATNRVQLQLLKHVASTKMCANFGPGLLVINIKQNQLFGQESLECLQKGIRRIVYQETETEKLTT